MKREKKIYKDGIGKVRRSEDAIVRKSAEVVFPVICTITKSIRKEYRAGSDPKHQKQPAGLSEHCG